MPQARSVRSVGRRCSKVRPTAELTMKRPTRNDSIPNAVRLRWKLSVRRSRSVSLSGSTRRSWLPTTPSSAARAPFALPSSRRDSWSGLLRSCCATPISTTSTSGTSWACACKGGSVAPLLVSGEAPSARCRSARVSGATRVCPGGARKAASPERPTVGALPTSPGRVSGSIPSRRKPWPSICTRPSRTGETGQPARRSATKSPCENVAPLELTSIGVRAPPNTAAARS